jgi:gamma-glutamyl-gamma-aminobutyrate hydrolase PuuD
LFKVAQSSCREAGFVTTAAHCEKRSGPPGFCVRGGPPDLWREVWERYLALLSWLLCLPTLGICRGMQFMNVALGGTILVDLPAQWPRDCTKLVRHRARGRVSSSNWVTHPVQLVRPNSRLVLAVKGRGELGRPVLDAVLSMHHQAVETLAPGLEVSAAAPDGVIEAFEDASPPRWWVRCSFIRSGVCICPG